ncbi:MAG TPA: hypothetical protein VNC78_10005 [Actinomycetota bacterium]|nr:hypothetical protein [Actinomycetota bacterium]
MHRAALAALVAVASSLLHAPPVALSRPASGDPNLLLQRTADLGGGDTKDVLWLAATDGSALRPWIPGASPAWSPAGDAVAFSAPGVKGVEDVFVLPIEGERPFNLTSSPGAETSPSWSPDGQDLAVVTAVGISILDLAGGSETLADAEGGAGPSWSPDGAEIAYVRAVGATRQLHVAAIDGSGSRQITSDAIDHSSPAWSPDGDADRVQWYRPQRNRSLSL